jgi:hypothetical protein
MQKNSLILLLVTAALIPMSAKTQSFEVNIVSPYRIQPSNGIETVEGDYILLFNNWAFPDPIYPRIVKIDQSGNVINDIIVDLFDYLTLTSIFYDSIDGSFIIIGSVASAPDFITDGIIVATYSSDLEMLEYTILDSPFQDDTIVSAALLNSCGNIVLTGYKFLNGWYGFVYVLDATFSIEKQALFNFSCLINSIVEYFNDEFSGYLITMNGKPDGLSTGEYLIKTDSSLNVLYYYPSNTMLFGGGLTCITPFDSLFILTGKYFRFVPPNYVERDVGVEIIDHNNTLLASNVFGKLPDTIDFPGVYSGAAVIDANNIFVPGTSNVKIMEYPYAPTPSWFMLNKLDGDLNLQWQKFYGGDAHYFLYGIIPSSDGGCVMLGTRYHPDNPTGIDGYILKVGPDGLVSVPEIPGGLQVREVIVFPNPGTSQLHIQTGHDDLEIRFYSTTGSLFQVEKVNRFIHTINTTTWPAGAYIYQIYKGESLLDKGKWIKAE